MIGVKFFSHIGNKWKFSTYLLAVVILLVTGIYIYRYEPFRSGFEISDELGGNIFPVTILSTATTDANISFRLIPIIWVIPNRASLFV